MDRPSVTIASCGTSCELMISPIPRPRTQQLQVKRPTKRRVVLADTKKPNSIVVLGLVADLLRSRGIEVAEKIFSKTDPSRPMTSAELDEVAGEEGLLLCGIAA